MPQLCDAISVRQVRRYALTGERFGAAEAQRIGLVHQVVPRADRLAAAGEEMVGRLLENGPAVAMAETKALAMESSFGGMGVDDEAYARLVRMHSERRQTSGGVGGAGVVCGEAARRNGKARLSSSVSTVWRVRENGHRTQTLPIIPGCSFGAGTTSGSILALPVLRQAVSPVEGAP